MKVFPIRPEEEPAMAGAPEHRGSVAILDCESARVSWLRRLDCILAGVLVLEWVIVAALAIHHGEALGQELSHRIILIATILAGGPLAVFVGRPDGRWTIRLMALSQVGLTALTAYTAMAKGGGGGINYSMATGYVTIAILASYPRRMVLATGLSAFAAIDFLRAIGWPVSYAGTPASMWVAHTALLVCEGMLLSYMAQERDRVHDDALAHFDGSLQFASRLQGLSTRAELVDSLADAGALFYIDLDRIGRINETHGFDAGDLVIRESARRLNACLRVSDVLAHNGGDEFLIHCPGISSVGQAEALSIRLLDAMKPPFDLDGQALRAGASIGVAFPVSPLGNPQAALHAAEKAAHKAKQRGRNCFVVQDCDHAPPRTALLEEELHYAIARGQLSLEYQPQIDSTGRTVCVEALARWRHPEYGNIPPGEFIPIAEESGLVLEMGEWILNEACRQGVAWAKEGLPPVRIAVNVSPVQFARRNFVDQVAVALMRTGLDPRLLEIEITETSLMLGRQEATEQLHRLRGLGVAVAIDDFGMGYSSLAYLQQLPVDSVKIDRNFVMGIESSPAALPLLAAMVMLASSLNLEVVVEGIETEAQLSAVWSLGADKAQGYLIARPNKPVAVAERLRRWSAPEPNLVALA